MWGDLDPEWYEATCSKCGQDYDREYNWGCPHCKEEKKSFIRLDYQYKRKTVYDFGNEYGHWMYLYDDIPKLLSNLGIMYFENNEEWKRMDYDLIQAAIRERKF